MGSEAEKLVKKNVQEVYTTVRRSDLNNQKVYTALHRMPIKVKKSKNSLDERRKIVVVHITLLLVLQICRDTA